MALRTARETDFSAVQALAPGLERHRYLRHIAAQRFRIVQDPSGHAVGFLKFDPLWERLPFLEVIQLYESERGKGYGTSAVRAWEAEMAAAGYPTVLVSTQADESAQGFWRHLGYEDCGALCLPGRASELFLQRSVV